MTLNLNELKRLAERAGKQQWTVSELLPCSYEVHVAGDYAMGGVCVPPSKTKAQFIAAANPATILALIERIEEAETRNALQQRALDAKDQEKENLLVTLKDARDAMRAAFEDGMPHSPVRMQVLGAYGKAEALLNSNAANGGIDL